MYFNQHDLKSQGSVKRSRKLIYYNIQKSILEIHAGDTIKCLIKFGVNSNILTIQLTFIFIFIEYFVQI